MPILDWLNKENDVKHAQKTPYKLLEEVPEQSFGDKNTGNLLIQGDNLEALKALLPFYAGQIKSIYIDPPYNTGSAFEHYDDNIEHSKWLSIMYPRLEIMRDLLKEDGSIWLSIDDDEGHYLKVICDEIFGRSNFVSNVVWQKKYSPQNDAKWLSDNHDHILIYAKNKNLWRPNLLIRTEEMNARYKNPDNDSRGPWKSVDFSRKAILKHTIYPITLPSGRVVTPPPNRSWLKRPEDFEEMKKQNLIWFGPNGDSVPSVKRFLSEVKEGVTSLTIWLYDEVGHNQDAKKEIMDLFKDSTTIFATPKPELLMKKIIHLSSNQDDIILDSFLGSGTTAAVAHKMGRKYIGIEMGEHAITHCVPRLKKVIEGEQGGISASVNWQGGGGFRFFKLGSEVFDAEGHIKKDINFHQLSAHIWFSETNTPYDVKKEKDPVLGIYEDTAYALLYNGVLGDKRPDGGNVLTQKTLDIIISKIKKKEYKKLIIYGEYSRLGIERLKAKNIEFKQTPYDVKAR